MASAECAFPCRTLRGCRADASESSARPCAIDCAFRAERLKPASRLRFEGQVWRTIGLPRRIDNINRIWMRVGLLPSDLTIAALPPIDPSVAVPREAATPVLELLRDHELARAKPMDTARRLFTSAAPENADVIETLEPVVQHWIEVTNWFMKRAHDDGRCDGESLAVNSNVSSRSSRKP